MKRKQEKPKPKEEKIPVHAPVAKEPVPAEKYRHFTKH